MRKTDFDVVRRLRRPDRISFTTLNKEGGLDYLSRNSSLKPFHQRKVTKQINEERPVSR